MAVRTRKPESVKPNKRTRSNKSSKSTLAWSSLDWGRLRLWFVGGLLMLLLFGLWGRAFYIQIVLGPELAAKAQRQQQAQELLSGTRGSILDRSGNILARSVESNSVWVNPTLIEDKAMTIAVLAKILELPAEQVARHVHKQKRFAWVVRKISDTKAKQIQQAALPGVYLYAESERVYPYKTLAGQLLGFVNVDDQGIEGLEKACDTTLAGKVVNQVVQRDAKGRRFGGATDTVTSLRGQDVRLSIDAQIQFFAEEALAESVDKFEAKWGGCIVVDVPTGEILAWAQYPFFDPNRPSAYEEQYRRNRLATDALEQGSTIKSFLVAAALEEKVVTPQTEINCERGKWKVGKQYIHDTKPYSILPVSKILHVSSNIGVAKIGFELGAQKYFSYLDDLGFGKQTRLPLAGQAKGILRNPESWQEMDLAATSFGQSFSATLVQMAKAYLCLASNGEARDLVLILDDKQEQATSIRKKLFSHGTMQQVRAMLREVVEEEGGTGKQARIPGIVVGGKTGTAQKADGSGKYGEGRVGSFVGMVPIDNPRYLICVLLDEPQKNPYGGVIAAPVFRDVALRTMAYHGHLPDSDDPLVKAIAQKEAARRRSSGVDETISTIGQTTTIAIAPSRAARAEAAILRRAKQNNTPVPVSAVVPSVVGLTVGEALEAFVAQGVIPEFQGAGGIVHKQEPAGGSAWPEDKQSCVIWLGDI